MGCVTKKDMKAPAARKREKIPLPECGPDSYVWVEAFGAKTLYELQQKYAGTEGEKKGDMMYEVFALCLHDDNSKLYDSLEDAKANWDLSPGMTETIFNECFRVSGLPITQKN
jgi:hypothetical protein